jgi:hypothetical protein
MPIFFNMSIAVHNDPDASKEWGWVQVGPAARSSRGEQAARVAAREQEAAGPAMQSLQQAGLGHVVPCRAHS